jgi:phenylpropionate dioxygenase-like ring-hydroxylating dioxygenase large terminal subunit
MLTIKHPKILTHKDTLKTNKFFGNTNYVVNKDLQLFLNRCPHRGNRIVAPGTCKEEFKCSLHGWRWDLTGKAINNNINLKEKNLNFGNSGLLFLDWTEPKNSIWVDQLKKESFTYSHSSYRYGTGDWRWQMEMHVDLLHVKEIHPLLNSYVDCENLKTEYGNDWICQHHEHGWWLFVYPFTHIEWEPGCLYISEMSPRENNQGYDVYIHYLFNESVNQDVKNNFKNVAEITFDEDIKAVNELSTSSKYRQPGTNLNHPLEKDIHHFYNWLEENTKE